MAVDVVGPGVGEVTAEVSSSELDPYSSGFVTPSFSTAQLSGAVQEVDALSATLKILMSGRTVFGEIFRLS